MLYSIAYLKTARQHILFARLGTWSEHLLTQILILVAGPTILQLDMEEPYSSRIIS